MYKRIIVESDFELLDLERGIVESTPVAVSKVLPYQQTMKAHTKVVEEREREREQDIEHTGDVESSTHKQECCSTPAKDVMSLWRLVKNLLLTSPAKPESSLL